MPVASIRANLKVLQCPLVFSFRQVYCLRYYAFVPTTVGPCNGIFMVGFGFFVVVLFLFFLQKRLS